MDVLNAMIHFEVMLNIVLIGLVSGLSLCIAVQGQRLIRYEMMLGKKRSVRNLPESQRAVRRRSEASERLAA